jgi:hypothetical protein
MPEYEVIEFSRTFETDDDVEVVAATMSAQGSRESNENASNFALVKRGGDEEYECGYELESGDECTRTVDGPDEHCWQHED